MLQGAALRQAWVGVGGSAPSSLVSGMGHMFCTISRVSSGVCGLQCLRKVPVGPNVNGPELVCSSKHLLPLPSLSLSCSPPRVFRSHFPDKTRALESLSQHLLLREPSLRGRTVLTQQAKKLPENAVDTKDEWQRPRTRDTFAMASCWHLDPA